MCLVDADPGAIAFSVLLKDFATGRPYRQAYIFIRDGNGAAVNGILGPASVARKTHALVTGTVGSGTSDATCLLRVLVGDSG